MSKFLIALCALGVLMTQSLQFAAAQMPAKSAAAPASSESKIDPKVMEIIKKLSDGVQTLEHARLKTYDEIEEMKDGVKIVKQQVRTVVMSRPNKLKIDSRGDISNKTIYKDDTMVTLVDHDENVYSQKEFKGQIDSTMENVLMPYGLSLPLAEYFNSQPYVTLMKRAKSGEYLGEHLVGELKCHHLLIKEENVYWQIWVDVETNAPRKVVITYPKQEGQPTYTVNMASVELLDASPAEEFAFTANPNAVKIQFMPLDTKPK